MSATTTHPSAPPLTPDDPGYDAAVASWNTLVRHRPAAAFVARTSHDVAAAVRYARRRGLGVGVLATGHGAAAIGPDGVLVNTSALTSVEIDSHARTATVGAGARWADVHARSAPYGLVGVSGSSSQVGVVGFVSGGGFGWLSRRLGFASSSVRSAEIVTADGDIHVVDAHHRRDLAWAVAGGAGNVGLVTGLTVDLHRLGDPSSRVVGGNLYYPLERVRDVAGYYAEWAPTLPYDFMSALTLRRFPPAPQIPEPLRGKAVIAIRGCYSGADLRFGRDLVDQARRALGEPLVDTFAELPGTALDPISADPTMPVPAVQRGETVTDIDSTVIERLGILAQGEFPFAMLEFRQLGGALTKAPRGPHPMARTSGMYSVNTISLVPDPADEARVRQTQDRFFAGIGESLTGSTYVNFLEGGPDSSTRLRKAYDHNDWWRLGRLKSRHDPDNLFRFGRTVPPNTIHHHFLNGALG